MTEGCGILPLQVQPMAVCALELGCCCQRRVLLQGVVARCLWPCALWSLGADTAATVGCCCVAVRCLWQCALGRRCCCHWGVVAVLLSDVYGGVRFGAWAQVLLLLPINIISLSGVYAGIIFVQDQDCVAPIPKVLGVEGPGHLQL